MYLHSIQIASFNKLNQIHILLVTLHGHVFHRVGQRGTGLSATIARSEHEISEIIDGLSEQEVGLILSFF